MDRRHLLHAALALPLVGVLAACKPQSVQFEGIDITGAEYGNTLPLHDVDGKQRSIQDFAGKVVVVFFGYAQCPDVCPTTLQEIAEARTQLGTQGDRLQSVFVSLDPERDTPEVLKAYMQALDPSAVALTGTPEQLATVAKDFKVFYKKVEGRQPGSYTLDHSAGLYIYDPQGRLRVYHRYGQGVDALVKDTKTLLGEAKS